MHFSASTISGEDVQVVVVVNLVTVKTFQTKPYYYNTFSVKFN